MKNTTIVYCILFEQDLKGVYHGKYWLTPSTSSFGHLHVTEWTWLTGSARASFRETDRSSPHASVLRMLHTRECCGRVVRSRIIPDWPRIGRRERRTVSSWHTPFNPKPNEKVHCNPQPTCIYTLYLHHRYKSPLGPSMCCWSWPSSLLKETSPQELTLLFPRDLLNSYPLIYKIPHQSVSERHKARIMYSFSALTWASPFSW